MFQLTYECDCGCTWEDQWSCACDDECPSCGADVSPSDATEYSDPASARSEGADAARYGFPYDANPYELADNNLAWSKAHNETRANMALAQEAAR